MGSSAKLTKQLLIKMGTLNNILPPLIGAEGTDSCGMCVTKGDPTGALRRGSSRAARGKRVPAAEINNYSGKRRIII
ncbi:hypothetical protein BTR22_17230 [Alkalihalophilus pseudofirmus]|nr:hypothetical protein BTR22_17230 [Alkalihalophilus pseudofirmus]